MAMKHIAGDVAVGFEIVDQHRQVLAKAVGTPLRIASCFVVVFDPIPNFNGNVELVIMYFFILPSSLSCGFPRLSTPWIRVLLDEGNCLFHK